MSLTIDAKYVQNLISDFDLSKICLGIGSEPIYEPYTGGIPSPNPDYPQEINSVVNPMVRVFGGTLGNKLNNKQINWLVENMNIWHDNNHFVLYDKFGINGSIRLIICVYENDTNNYSCTLIDTDGNTTPGAYQFDYTNTDVENNFIYCNMLPIIDTHNVSKVIDVDSNKTVGLPNNYQTVTIPYTLNAIPVESGGNVTIDGQQYVADYVDVERGKVVRMIGVANQDVFATSKWNTGSIVIYSQISNVGADNAIVTISSEFSASWSAGDEIHHFTQLAGQTLVIVLPKTITTVEQGEEIRAKGFKFYYILITPIEIDLTTEEITSFKALATYYPTTNISVNSEQLDGYTVFNYPISMANGWNYVKKQLNDNRDYIYDMDTQSAEAYVNSEYAVALTELEV